MKIRAVIFDLDGTLLDTLEDIAAAANAVLESTGRAAFPNDDYRFFVGDGVKVLFQRALGAAAEPELVELCATGFRSEYAKCWHRQSKPYPGIKGLIQQLTERELRLAVLSNKPDEFTQACVAKFFPEDPFRVVVGQRNDLPRKPSPEGANWISQRLGVAPSECLYVGDTSVDMQTACAAGMPAIGVNWGFRARAELVEAGAAAIVDHPREILALLGE